MSAVERIETQCRRPNLYLAPLHFHRSCLHIPLQTTPYPTQPHRTTPHTRSHRAVQKFLSSHDSDRCRMLGIPFPQSKLTENIENEQAR